MAPRTALEAMTFFGEEALQTGWVPRAPKSLSGFGRLSRAKYFAAERINIMNLLTHDAVHRHVSVGIRGHILSGKRLDAHVSFWTKVDETGHKLLTT